MGTAQTEEGEGRERGEAITNVAHAYAHKLQILALLGKNKPLNERLILCERMWFILCEFHIPLQTREIKPRFPDRVSCRFSPTDYIFG